MMKRYLFIVALLCISLFSKASDRDTLRVLFVGNSYIYYNNLIQMVSLISDSLDTKLICTKSTVGGTRLREHWNEEKGLRSKSLIENGKYDIVIFQDHSLAALEQPDSLLYFGNKFCSLIKSKGAKPFLYNTWSRKTTPQTQPIINKVYQQLSNECEATLVKVGDYWQEAIKRSPNIEMYNIDGSHPSHLGTFMAALAFVKSITGQLPERLPSVYNYYDKDGETFRIMQVSQEEIKLFKEIVTSF